MLTKSFKTSFMSLKSHSDLQGNKSVFFIKRPLAEYLTLKDGAHRLTFLDQGLTFKHSLHISQSVVPQSNCFIQT